MAVNEEGKFTKLTPETIKKLEEVFAMDGTLEEACFYAEISKQTYYNWINENPELNERFDSLRQRPFLKARQTIIKSLDNPDMAFKYMERKKRKEFGNNIDLTSDHKPLPLLGGQSNGISDNSSDE